MNNIIRSGLWIRNPGPLFKLGTLPKWDHPLVSKVSGIKRFLCSYFFSSPCSPDKNKATVQVLQDHTDVWHIGKESIDMRIHKNAFAHVQRFFPECSVIIEDVEAHVQAAEQKMFPKKKVEQEAWLQAVVQAMLPKVSHKNH